MKIGVQFYRKFFTRIPALKGKYDIRTSILFCNKQTKIKELIDIRKRLGQGGL